ncbi:MAG TPA: DUF1761 domain-containing protein [Gemmataceae bacterium]|nr:DUF1761 domain-containing protein [Gemmataceae bacterium]
MPFDFAKINWLAVAVAALVAFFVGAIWYTALFGKLWIKLHGFSDTKVKEMQANMSPPRFFGGMILSYLVLALTLAVLLTGFAEPNLTAGVFLGLVFWMGSSAIAATGHIASDKVHGVYLIDVGCHLVYLVLMGALLGAWRA